MTSRLLTGDCRAVLATLESASIDACATDPPYGIGFLGREWDVFEPSEVAKRSKPRNFTDPFLSNNPNLQGRSGWQGHAPVEYDRSAAASRKFQAWTQQWAEAVLRVLKPGAHAVVCASPRMAHRVTCGLEDAGFEIRESVLWLYGSGFPKSINVGKQLDRRPGASQHAEFAAHLKARREALGLSTSDVAERIVGTRSGACWNWEHHQFPESIWWPALRDLLELDEHWGIVLEETDRKVAGTQQRTSGFAPGQGSYPKVSRDITTPATDLAHQWDGWGTALKPAYEPVILARKPLGGRTVAQCVAEFGTGALNIDGCRLEGAKPGGLGRWPPNVAMDEAAAATLDAEVGERSGTVGAPRRRGPGGQGWGFLGHEATVGRTTDVGGPSRFFYCPKASREERERGCEDLPRKTAGEATDRQDGSAGLNSPRAGASRTQGARNHHPTVKPVALMRWLVRLVTPPGGLVLDPFAGSGTTGIACVHEQMRFLGMEREAEYVRIAEARIGAAVVQFQTGGPLFAALDTPDTPGALSLVPAEPTPCA